MQRSAGYHRAGGSPSKCKVRAIRSRLRGVSILPLQILIVDDEPKLVELIAEYMRTRGHNVDVVRDGAEALRRLEQQGYDALISNLNTPKVGGLELLGQRLDVPALLARAQVFVHCSKEEGLGQSVLEAMRAGVPVVATRAGGVPESVGERGILVDIQNPPALAEGITRVLAGEGPDPALAQTYADQHFSVSAMVSGTLRAYEGFVSGLA